MKKSKTKQNQPISYVGSSAAGVIYNQDKKGEGVWLDISMIFFNSAKKTFSAPDWRDQEPFSRSLGRLPSMAYTR